MKRQFLLISVLFITIGLGSCKSKLSATSEKETKIPTGNWILSQINSRNIAITPNNGKTPTIILSDTTTRFGGNNGCNSYGGIVKFNKSSVKFDIQFSTKKFCMDAIDAEFDSTLQVINLWAVEKNRLILKKDAKILMEFEPQRTK